MGPNLKAKLQAEGTNSNQTDALYSREKTDQRSQLVRFDENGSTQVNPKNPSPDTLIQKPFGFKYNPITSRSTDLQRFTKFLGTASGARFQANYAILQQAQQDLNNKVAQAGDNANTRIGSFVRRATARIAGTFLGNVGFTANIAKQIPVSGTGTHFINNTSGRFYLDDTGGVGGVVKQQFKNFLKNTFNLNTKSLKGGLGTDPEGTGRIVSKLKDRLSRYNTAGSGGSFDNGGIPEGIGKLKAKFNLGKFGGEDIRNAVVGTNALSGTGAGFAEDAQELGPYKDFFGKGISGLETNQVGRIKYNQSTPRYDEETVPGDANDPNIRITKIEEEVKRNSSQTPYNSIIKDGKEVTVKNTIHQKVGKDNNEISRKDFFESDTLDISLEQEETIQTAYGQQLIPFSFSSITPDKSYTLHFNAFLDSFNDSYQGTWNGTQYIGRAEQFYTYQGFGRDVNFGFKVAAFRREDINRMYRKLNLLAGTTAPSYSTEGNFMRGTLTRVTIGDLIYRLNGYISAVDLAWNTTYPWEMDVDDKGDISKVPHLLDVSVRFTPIHNFNVKSNLDFVSGEKYFGTKLGKADVIVGDAKIDSEGFSEETLNNSGYSSDFIDTGGIGGLVG